MPTSIGPYTVVSELGRGGMGVVYRARGPAGEDVAVKVLLDGGAADPERVARFQREVGVLEALEHPGILRVRGHGIERGLPYMVLELLEGSTLEQLVKAEGPLPEARAVELGQRLADALAYAHAQGVVHRDLKPSNVMLRDGRPVVVDFGLVRLLGLDRSRLTETGAVLGSLSYMAPEQAQGEETGPGADVYGLGATLYYLLTGRAPFPETASLLQTLSAVVSEPPPAPRRLRPELNAALEEVVLRCLRKRSAERFPSAADLGVALKTCGGDARPRWSSVHVLALLSLLLAITGVVAVVTLARSRGSDSSASEGPAVTEPPAVDRPHRADVDPAPSGEDPPELLPLLRRLHAWVQAEEDARVLREAERALQRHPGSPRLHVYRGIALFNLGREEEGQAAIERGLELNPELAFGYMARGMQRYLDARFPAALADCDRALELEPGLLEGLELRAELLFRTGDFAGSLRDLDRRLAADPASSALHKRALVYHQLGRLDEAEADLVRARALDPHDAEVQLELAELDLTRGRYADALAAAGRTLELGGVDGLAHFCRARALVGLGRFEDALAALERTLELEPERPEPMGLRAQVLFSLGRFEEALRDVDRALESVPHDVSLRGNRAMLLAELDRDAEALLEADRVVAQVPDSPTARFVRGRVRERAGHDQGAVEDYERALLLGHPNVAQLRDRLTRLRAGLRGQD